MNFSLNSIKLFICLSLLSFFGINKAIADDPKIKWGKPSMEEMNMTSYPQDETADAVVLYDETDARYQMTQGQFHITYNYRTRIKVLTEDGKEWANGSITFRHNGGVYNNNERITKLKATAYNLENGKIVKSQIKDDMVSNEDISKVYRVTKFTVPQVKVGSVIECEYELQSDFYLNVRDWIAQYSIPVAYSKYRITIPCFFRCSVNTLGLEKLEHKVENTSLIFSVGNGGSMKYECDDYCFVGRNLPALKDTKYLFDKDNYAQRVTVEIQGLAFPGQTYKNFAQTWPQIDNLLIKDSDFGGLLDKNPLKNEMKELGIYDIQNVNDKVKAIAILLRSKIKFNGNTGLYCENLSDALKEGSANNTTINFLFINMLRDAGISADPMVMCSRDNGFLPFANPSLMKLNNTVATYQIGDKRHYFDATTLEYGCTDILTPEMLVDRAHIVNKNHDGEWISLVNVSKSETRDVILGAISKDGVYSGDFISKKIGLSAYNFRKDFDEEEDSVTYVNKLAADNSFDIENYETSGRNDYSPNVTEKIKFTKQCDTTDDRIYFNPQLILAQAQSDFLEDTRKLPVEFPSCDAHTIKITVTLPDGYTIEELPQNIKMTSGQSGLSMEIQTMVNGNKLMYKFSSKIGKLLYAPNEYNIVKSFFEELAKHCNQQVVLKKTDMQ